MKIEYALGVGLRWGLARLTILALVAFGCGRTTDDDGAIPANQLDDGGSSAAGETTGAVGVEAGTTSSGAAGAPGSAASSTTGATTGVAGAGSEPVDEVECNAPDLATSEEWALRLERLFWDTDAGVLADAVASGELDLSGASQVQAQALTLLKDAELGRVGLPAFVKRWLSLDETRLSMSDDLLASTLESTDRTLQAMIFEDDAPLSVFFSGDWAIVDEVLADYYGVEAPDGEWGVVTLPEPRQAGLLGQHFWLNATSHPAYRGMVLATALRCMLVPPPPLSEPVRATQRTDVTRREEYQQNVAQAECAGCHYWLAPLGLPFEHFDGWGDYRTEDNGFPVDATGGVPDTDIEVDGARQLGAVFANQLASETQHCLARQVVAYSLGEPGALQTSVFDELECFERLNADLVASDTSSFLEWVVALVGSPVFLAEY